MTFTIQDLRSGKQTIKQLDARYQEVYNQLSDNHISPNKRMHLTDEAVFLQNLKDRYLNKSI